MYLIELFVALAYFDNVFHVLNNIIIFAMLMQLYKTAGAKFNFIPIWQVCIDHNINPTSFGIHLNVMNFIQIHYQIL